MPKKTEVALQNRRLEILVPQTLLHGKYLCLSAAIVDLHREGVSSGERSNQGVIVGGLRGALRAVRLVRSRLAVILLTREGQRTLRVTGQEGTRGGWSRNEATCFVAFITDRDSVDIGVLVQILLTGGSSVLPKETPEPFGDR